MARDSASRARSLGRNEAADRQEAFSVPLTTAETMTSQRDIGSEVTADTTIPSDPAEARRVQDEIEQHLQAQHAPEKDIFSIKLALEEALVNAIKHGNQMDRSKKVRIVYRVRPDRFEIAITDEGPGFDPSDVPDPTAFENLERPCGRGLMLMRHYMNEVEYTNGGNCVTMCKIFKNAANGKK
jgi:serine/threonine-protein kinase RsbW